MNRVSELVKGIREELGYRLIEIVSCGLCMSKQFWMNVHL